MTACNHVQARFIGAHHGGNSSDRTTVMYASTRRRISEHEAKRLRREVSKQRAKVKETPRLVTCSLGCFFVPGIVLLYLFHATADAWLTVLLCLVAIVALLASSFLDSAAKSRRRIHSIEEAIKNGTAVEHNIVSSRCFKIEGEDEGSDYYFDIGGQGTVVVNDAEFSCRRFPSSEFTLVNLFDQQGKALHVSSWCRSQRLSPVACFARDDLWTTPALAPYAHPDSMTVFPVEFDDLLSLFRQNVASR
jgi:hypothetical protein